MSTCSDPTGTHEKSVSTCIRSSSGRLSRSKNTPTVTTNEAKTISVASQPARIAEAAPEHEQDQEPGER